MREDVSGLIADWGVTCTVTRFDKTLNASGRYSGTFATLTSMVMWIQPKSMTEEDRETAGIIDATTHELFEWYDGPELREEDRVLPSGDTYEYDVLGASVFETHRHAWLKRVKRS